jgi:hypothetical protein
VHQALAVHADADADADVEVRFFSVDGDVQILGYREPKFQTGPKVSLMQGD